MPKVSVFWRLLLVAYIHDDSVVARMQLFYFFFFFINFITGKATRGYDPAQDIEWLRSEVVRWVQGNLMEKW